MKQKNMKDKFQNFHSLLVALTINMKLSNVERKRGGIGLQGK